MKQFDVTFSYTLGGDQGTWNGQITAQSQVAAVEQAKAALLADHPGAQPGNFNCVDTGKQPTAKLRLVHP